MKRNYFFSALVTLLFALPSFTVIKGQNAEFEDVMDSASIEQQFEYIFEKSSRYEQYKVIRETWLNRYRQSLDDTVNGLRNRISENEKMIAAKNEQIQDLNNIVETTREELKSAIKEKNSLVFLGIKMDKTIYNLIMWILVAALAFALVIVFMMYKKSHSVTTEAVSNSEKVQKEYDEYRNNSRLKIEKLKREHLDEILKLKNNS